MINLTEFDNKPCLVFTDPDGVVHIEKGPLTVALFEQLRKLEDEIYDLRLALRAQSLQP